MTPAAAGQYLDELERFLGGQVARQLYGSHVCMAAQPQTPNGSPDELVSSGVDAGAGVAQRWVDTIVRSLEQTTTESAIRQMLTTLPALLPLQPFADVVHGRVLSGCLLGALDSQWERDHGIELAPVRFDQRETEPHGEIARLWNQRKVLPRPAYDALDAGARRRAFTVAGLARGELLNDVHAELGRQLAAGARDREGPNLQDFSKFVDKRLKSAGWTPANASHVETIFRTNIMSAYSSGRFAEMRQPAVMQALPYWQIRTVKDSRQRPTHRAADGRLLRADDPFWRHAYPPFGYNCFLPETPIRGVITGASRAWYAGKTFEFTTRKGRRFSVTADHPILSGEGFVPAKTLRYGSQLFGYANQPGVELLRAGSKWNENQAPARAEDVFRTLSQAQAVGLANAGSDDFHGEAKRFVGQVEVVGSYRHLGCEEHASQLQQFRDLLLEASYPTGLSLGASSNSVLGVLRAAACDPSAPYLPLYSHWIAPLFDPLGALRLGSPAHLDALLTEQASKGLTADSELGAQLLDRSSGLIERDCIVRVREFDFDGHVYDFETVNGWLAADGIVASNCRCRVCARSAAWVKATNATIGPPPTGLPDPGFDSGTRTLISVPDGALHQAPAQTAPPVPQPSAPPAPAPIQPTLPSPPPALPFEPVVVRPPWEQAAPPAPHVHTAQEFKAAGVYVNKADLPDIQARATLILGRAFDPQFVKDLAGAQQAMAEIGAEGRYTVTTARDGGVAIQAAFGSNAHIVREYHRNKRGELIVHHAYFTVEESAQGAGLGKRILRNQVEQYERLGVAKIKTEAAWVGQYTWPRMGFELRSPKKLEALKLEFAAFLQATYDMPFEEATAHMAHVDSIHQLAMTQLSPRHGVDPEVLKAGKRFLVRRGKSSGPLIELQVRRNGPEYQILRRYLGLPPLGRR